MYVKRNGADLSQDLRLHLKGQRHVIVEPSHARGDDADYGIKLARHTGFARVLDQRSQSVYQTRAKLQGTVSD